MRKIAQDFVYIWQMEGFMMKAVWVNQLRDIQSAAMQWVIQYWIESGQLFLPKLEQLEWTTQFHNSITLHVFVWIMNFKFLQPFENEIELTEIYRSQDLE